MVIGLSFLVVCVLGAVVYKRRLPLKEQSNLFWVVYLLIVTLAAAMFIEALWPDWIY